MNFTIVNCFIKDVLKYNRQEEDEIQENLKDKYFDFNQIPILNKENKEKNEEIKKEELFLKTKRKKNLKISEKSAEESFKSKGNNLFRVFTSQVDSQLSDMNNNQEQLAVVESSVDNKESKENNELMESNENKENIDLNSREESLNLIHIHLKCLNIDENNSRLYEAILVST